ncbi:MAG TPA: hypothetical protein VJH34_03675 [archaeon]|nr:hypothetical protein [archaeon]
MKGIAVEQMIMLALGVIVLALVGYLLYSNYISTSGQVSTEQCKTSLINACNNCKLANSPKGNWDPAKYNALDSQDSTGSTHNCAKITNTCMQAMNTVGIVTTTSSTYDPDTQAFTQSVCSSVGVN